MSDNKEELNERRLVRLERTVQKLVTVAKSSDVNGIWSEYTNAVEKYEGIESNRLAFLRLSELKEKFDNGDGEPIDIYKQILTVYKNEKWKTYSDNVWIKKANDLVREVENLLTKFCKIGRKTQTEEKGDTK